MTSLDGMHDVGTFVQITELHDTGKRMRMIIQGHRRLIHPPAVLGVGKGVLFSEVSSFQRLKEWYLG